MNNPISQQDAKKSIQFYWKWKENDSELLGLEIERLKVDINADAMRYAENPFRCSELMTRQSVKALTIGMVLVALCIFSGITPLTTYTAMIFKEAGSTLSPNMSAFIMVAMHIPAGLIAVFIVDCVGRKVFSFENISQKIQFSMTNLIFFCLVLIHNVRSWNGFRFDCFRCLYVAQNREL